MSVVCCGSRVGGSFLDAPSLGLTPDFETFVAHHLLTSLCPFPV